MLITKGIEMLEIKGNVMGSARSIYPTLFHDDEQCVLVDAGFPGQVELFRAAIEQAGLAFERLNTIIVTHHDFDHIGGLKGMLEARSGAVTTLAHRVERPYISGEQTPHKLAGMEARLGEMPPEEKAFYEQFKAAFAASYTAVDRTLDDDQQLPICGGLKVIATPGHTLGHICLYHAASKTLVAGDMLRVDEGRLTAAPANINYNQALYDKSLQKLAQYAIETVICYHGGSMAGDIQQKIAALAAVDETKASEK